MKDIHHELIDFIESGSPFHRFLNIQVIDAKPGAIKLRLPYKEEFGGNMERGILHGGISAMFVDIVAASTLWTHLGPEDKTATIDLRVDYQRPAMLEDLLGEGEVRMMGNSIANVHVRLYSASTPDTVQAEGRAVFHIKRKR
ncbi:PaaI family thioesterase [Halodesulfovibrio sp.]|uniref:PaaI family thioesterase n=1 Tax=Halodesulfovibrio sp. TaxID=1912772 RepID=UPI0025BEBBDE|nr:PaaI family thioesterase [Halodesulfovibrio sp.]